MAIKIALAGNPNSGKTTMFNGLTGSSQYVGNWPGVTVEKKEGKLKGHKDVIIQDLPGIYSLSPYTLEEVITRNYLIGEKPSAIINIVDSSNIERNLYLTSQLTEIGVPVIIALNMSDVIKKNGDKIDIKKISDEFGCEVIETSALKGTGIKEAAERAIAIANSGKKTVPVHKFSEPVEKALFEIEKIAGTAISPEHKRWALIKLFERDEKYIEQVKLKQDILQKIEAVIKDCETKLDDDSESIITNERYEFITKVMHSAVKKRVTGLTTSDKIDKIVTNRWLAIPIFVLVMFLIYFISISTVGTMGTDWVNDVLFTEIIPPAVEGWLGSVNAADWLTSLILDGVIGGVGAVLGFLPQMLVLFLLLAILESCGYMARIAFIMDRIFRKFGLSGKSFIPILIGTGCSVPGIMASRTIENDRDRKMTITVTSFMPCGAKLPVIALIAGALFDDAWWLGPSAYFIGMLAIVVSGIMLKKTKMFAGDPAPFVMELPTYRIPGVKGVLLQTWDRGKSFIIKAGTIIFLACALIWFLSSFGFDNGLVMVEDQGDSILAGFGKVLAPIFNPLGWGDWQSAVATITGLVAKENIVGTFGILFGVEVGTESGEEIWGLLRDHYSTIAAYSFLIFNLLCAPCFAAIGAIKREMGNWKWTLFAVGYQTFFAYAVALCFYQIGNLIINSVFGVGTVIAILLIGLFILQLFKPNYKLKANKLT